MSKGIREALEKDSAKKAELETMMAAKKEKHRQKTEEETRAAWTAEQSKDDVALQARIKNIYQEIRHQGMNLSEQVKQTRDRIDLKVQEMEDIRASLTKLRDQKEKIGQKAAFKDLESKNEALREATLTLEAGQKMLMETVKELDNLRAIEQTKSEKLKGLMEESERIQGGQVPSEKIYDLLPGLARTEAVAKTGAAIAAEYGDVEDEAATKESAEQAILSLLGGQVEDFVEGDDKTGPALEKFKDEMIGAVLGSEVTDGLTGAELQMLKDNDAWNAVKNAKSGADGQKLAATLQTRIKKAFQGAMKRRKGA